MPAAASTHPRFNLLRRALCARACAATAGVGLAGLLAACSPPPALRIGFIGGITGRVADIGTAGRNGVQLAVDDLNAAGGINGRAVELLIRDDEQNDDVARRHLSELADAGVQLIIGPMTSSIAVALAPMAMQRGLALVSPTATAHELTGKADAFFRVVSDAPRSAIHQAEFLYAQGHRSMAAIADLKNKAFSQSWSSSALRRFGELGGRVALDTTFESNPGVEYAELARQLLQAKADVILIVASAADSAMLIQHLRRGDAQIQLTTSSWAGTGQLIQLGGRAAEGTLVPQLFDRASQAPLYLQFVARFQQRYGEAPGFGAVNGYDATLLGAKAIRQRREGQSVLEAMRAIRSHGGLQRDFALDEFGDSGAPKFLARIQNGQFVLIDQR